MKRAVAAVCVLALALQSASAATFNVTGNGDSGAGTLRQAILDSNGAGGANTLSWSGIGGTILPLSDFASINANTTLDASNATSAVVISGTSRAMPLGGAVTFNNTSTTQNWTIFSLLSGAGSLTKTGAGTLTLANANTFSGGSFLNAGTVAVSNNTALGTGLVTFNGGTLQFGALNLSLGNAVTINAGGATVDTNGYDATLSGAVGGAGALTKAGGGTLFLSGASTYGGATTINAGTLAMAAGGSLPAATDVTAAAGATFDVSNAVQTVNSYTGPGILKVQLGAATPLTVTGNANLTNGTLRVAPSGATPVKTGDTFTALAWGTRTGTFATIVSPAAVSFTSVAPAYGANSLVVTATLVPFANAATTPNQVALGGVLEPLRANPTGDVATILSQLYQLDAAGLGDALDQLSPISLSGVQALGMAGAGLHAAAIGRRAAALADGGPGEVSSYRLARRSAFPGELVASAGIPDAPAASEKTGSNWGGFGALVGTIGDVGGGASSSGSQPSYSFASGGAVAGVDRKIGDGFAAGVSAGYIYGEASTYTSASGLVQDGSTRFGAYASGWGDSLRGDLYAGGALDSLHTQRDLNFGTIQRTAKANPSATELSVDGNLACDLRPMTWATVAPFVGLEYSRMRIAAFTETGADSMNLSVDPQTIESLQSSLGAKLKFKTPSRRLVPYFSLAWRRENLNQDRTVTARFPALGGASFATAASGWSRDGAVAGAGLKLAVGDRASVSMDYSGDFRPRVQRSDLSAALRISF